MRVLLVSTNRLNTGMPPYPLGLACVAASLDPARHTVQVWDAMFETDWRGALGECVATFAPDVIGFSVRNVDDQNMRSPAFFLNEAREMVATCRQHSAATLVGGGSGFSIFPETILEYLGLDCGVAGEGERAFPALLEALAAGRGLAALPGVVRRENGRPVANPPDWAVVLDQVPPVHPHAGDLPRYYAATGSPAMPNPITLQSKRGCPLRCAYCSTFAVEGSAIRCRKPQRVVEEMEWLCAQGFQRLHFVDSVFTNPAWHARAICDELIRRGLDARWSATVNPGWADPELLRLMRRAGCVLLLLGNEHADAGMLQTLGKGFDPEQVAGCFTVCQEEGLAYHAFLLLGGPGEDRASVERSVAFLQRFEPAFVNVSVAIRLYPGCELTRIAVQEGQLGPGDDLLTPRFYLAPAVRDWIWEYMDAIVAQSPRWGY